METDKAEGEFETATLHTQRAGCPGVLDRIESGPLVCNGLAADGRHGGVFILGHQNRLVGVGEELVVIAFVVLEALLIDAEIKEPIEVGDLVNVVLRGEGYMGSPIYAQGKAPTATSELPLDVC